MKILECLLQTPQYVKARLSLATRVAGVRKLSRSGTIEGIIIYKIVLKDKYQVRIALLSGATMDFKLPQEAGRSDFWASTWLVQMANIKRSIPPRQAAILLRNEEIISPWTRLSEIAHLP